MLHGEPEYRRRITFQNRERQQNANEEAREAAQNARISQIELSVIGIGEQISAYSEESRRQERGKRHRELAEIGALLLAAGVGIAAIIHSDSGADKQWRAMQAQQAVMSAQVSEMQIEQRPWVGMHGIEPISSPLLPKDSPSVAYFLVLVNAGKSPAMGVNIKIDGGPGDCSLYVIPKQRCSGSECTFENLEMLPNVPVGRRIPSFINGPVRIGGEICLIARADYTDPTGRPHKTGICLIHSPRGDRRCSDANSNYAD